MFIKIREIPDAGQTLHAPLARELMKDVLAGFDSNLDEARGEVNLDVSRTDDHVILRGRAVGDVKVPCVRCLKEVATRIDAPIRMVFSPEGDAPDEDELDADAEYATHNGAKIELDDLIREALILAMPLNPLCGPACKGLCTVCGGDKNERDCGCVVALPEIKVPALQAALKQLKL